LSVNTKRPKKKGGKTPRTADGLGGELPHRKLHTTGEEAQLLRKNGQRGRKDEKKGKMRRKRKERKATHAR